MKAEPLTKNYSLVGTAFDYFILFYLKKKHLQEINEPVWKAEIICNTMARGKLEISNHKLFEIPTRFMLNRRTPLKDEKKIKQLVTLLDSAQNSYHKYIKTGVVSEEMLQSCFFLAKIETSLNSKFDSNLHLIDQKDIEDLKNLINTLSSEAFYFKDQCIIKPSLGVTFHPNLTEVDLLVDDTIIDIKATIEPNLTRAIFRQLVIYFILYNFNGATKFTLERPINNFSVNKMGIYFARHGVLYKFNAEDVFLPSGTKNIVLSLLPLIDKYEFQKGKKRYDSDLHYYH
ncbi:MAG: hypothetical protein JXA98_06885 [Methanosarcinaceae archaeon]|nr:hypothetical protein [Methanosarcinaceae archaeon]